MAPQSVAWRKDPVFTQGGPNLPTEMLAGWISLAGAAAPMQCSLVCKWAQCDQDTQSVPSWVPTEPWRSLSPPRDPQSRGTLHPLPGTHRAMALAIPAQFPVAVVGAGASLRDSC